MITARRIVSLGESGGSTTEGAARQAEQPTQSDVMTDTKREPARLHSGPSRTLEVYAEATLPTAHGEFRTVVFREKKSGLEHVAMVMGEVAGKEGVAVRVHSECMTSEVFGSLKCDCKAQLDHAIETVARAGLGAIIYLRQEGRGIGLGNKIRAYALQEQGLDTFEANRQLGFADDLRRYDAAAEMLRLLGIRSVDLITNNPLKIAAMVDENIPVRRRIASVAPVHPHNHGYLLAKVERTGHFIDLPQPNEKAGTKAS
jgi:GTP cyclohydrolase II/3,4-dihydroxy 2-butanone 4-phosphate synthase/GTP cyclohydrolase II